MRAHVVTLRFDPLLEAFDDSPLQEMLKTREVFSICDCPHILCSGGRYTSGEPTPCRGRLRS